ncbi:MAG: exo-alpha-sialidase, partial [Candidatus Hydrogenedentes bacterium]|nr:exo-alpha-sialidase [Candidatus Hydrogenedentota bacterium]
MDRRRFLARLVQGTAASAAAGATSVAGAESSPSTRAIPLLDHAPVIVYESPTPAKVYAYSPGIAVLPDGTLVATFDHEHTVKDETCPDGAPLKGRVCTSSDGGRTWTQRAGMPIYHARPFVAGKSVYVLGHNMNLGIMRSDDGGATWTAVTWLTQDQEWHQAPCNVHYCRGRVYLVMERVTDPSWPEWPVHIMAPVLMSAPEEADLTRREAWTFSSEITYRDVVAEYGKPNLIGVPFFNKG